MFRGVMFVMQKHQMLETFIKKIKKIILFTFMEKSFLFFSFYRLKFVM